MKFGKFYDKAKEAKSRLRPGEVKRYDKKLEDTYLTKIDDI